MKVLYVGNILSQKQVEKYNLSIAGKKYELALLRSLNDLLENDLDIISLGRVVGKKLEYNDFLFQNKKYKVLYKSKYPIISDLILNINFIFEFFIWFISNINHKKAIIVLNSPFGISLVLVLLKYLFRIKVFSLTIDTPFISEHNFSGVLGKYAKIKFKLGHKLLHFFTGIAVLNKNVIDVLNLKIPFILTKIGYSKNENINSITPYHKKAEKFTIVYVGTLMKFKGIDKLMLAVSQMNNKIFRLEICGDGPLKEEIISFIEKFDNISYRGRVSNDDMRIIQGDADLLVNITQIENKTEDFCFPSKLIDYILSGRPVLTNQFSALAVDFNDFVHMIETPDVDGLKIAIENVYSISESELQKKCKLGFAFITEKYSYKKISEELLDFMVNTKL